MTNTRGKLFILHLSDIHIKKSSDEILNRSTEIARAIYSELPSIDKLIIAVTGDITWSGTEQQYILAEKLLGEITKNIKLEQENLSVEIVTCPGNHDLDFSHHDEVRDAVISSVRNGAEITSRIVEATTAPQREFFLFAEKISTLAFTHRTGLTWRHETTVENKQINILCLNVAWMSSIKEKQGTLIFPDSEIKSPEKESRSPLNITLLHHPFNWFSQSSYHAFRNTVRTESHIVLTGHEHYQNIGETEDIHASPSIFIEGGVLFDQSQNTEESSFNTLLVDLIERKYVAGFYRWDGKRYCPSLDEEKWGSLRPLPSKEKSTISITENFNIELEDAGAKFSHPAKRDIKLSDIFVWPELKYLDDTTTIKSSVSGSHFESIENIPKSGVIIRGDEKSGKSTLLRQYFRSYTARGYLPILIRGSWLQKQHIRDPLKVINLALEKEYHRKHHIDYLQEPKGKKVLFLDDIQKSNLSGKNLSECLENLFSHFSAVIITSRDGAESMEILTSETVPALAEMPRYEIREFGHKKRYELVRKWLSIDRENDETSQKWMASIDRMEKALTTAVGKQLVPSAPIFLLTLLQSVEANRTTDLQNSALGHYYHFLISSSLEAIGIEREQWSEIFNYCSNLAWSLFSSQSKQISEGALAEFNASYIKEFSKIAPQRRTRELIESGIITHSDDHYQFRYNYLYHMFLGQYLAEHIHEAESLHVIEQLCEDIHLRDHANTLLFISHYNRSPVIYENISQALARCFTSNEAFDFNTNVVAINRLIEAAPRLLFVDTPGEDRRAQIRESQDEIDDEESAEPVPMEGAAAAITRLFRGIEILGQFLKNHYGTIRNNTKNELIDTLIQSSLRGLSGVTTKLLSQHETLTEIIERVLKDKRSDLAPHTRKQLARQIIFDLFGMIAFGFVQKTSTCVGSEFLQENLSKTVQDSGSLAFRIIELSYRLDLPLPIPFDQIHDLQKDLEGNIFGQSLLRSLALRHLHMFKVSFKDKQRLCSDLGIEMSRQNAIQQERRSIS